MPTLDLTTICIVGTFVIVLLAALHVIHLG
jgi:hypothetical protein